MDPLAHASVGLLAKTVTPKAPLWALIVATEVPDILFYVFEAMGLEHQAVTSVNFLKGTTYLSPALFPWSHGLMMCVLWSLIVGLICRIFIKDMRTCVVVGLMLFSHWILDALAYSNIPIGLDGSQLIGLGLINTGIGMFIGIGIEIFLILGGIIIYWRYWKNKKIIEA